MRGLSGPLENFFTTVFVMDKDPDIRENRLRLLRAIGSLVRPIADFRKLRAEGKA